MANYQIAITVDVPDQYLSDIMTTAIEGGIGYWCAAQTIARDDRDQSVTRVVGVFDRESGDAFTEPAAMSPDITRETIVRGLGALVKGAQVRRDIRAAVVASLMEPGDGCDLDAEACDVIVQLGLFGEIVYG